MVALSLVVAGIITDTGDPWITLLDAGTTVTSTPLKHAFSF
jgi:hypothetical protein